MQQVLKPNQELVASLAKTANRRTDYTLRYLVAITYAFGSRSQLVKTQPAQTNQAALESLEARDTRGEITREEQE